MTARGVVKLVVTNLGVFEPRGEAFLLRETAPGHTVDEVAAVTGVPLNPAPNLCEVRV